MASLGCGFPIVIVPGPPPAQHFSGSTMGNVPEGGETSTSFVFLPSQYVLLFDPSVGEEGGAAVVPTTVKSFQSPGRFVDNTETDTFSI